MGYKGARSLGLGVGQFPRNSHCQHGGHCGIARVCHCGQSPQQGRGRATGAGDLGHERTAVVDFHMALLGDDVVHFAANHYRGIVLVS